MEAAIVSATIVQAVTAVVIAVATIVYTRISVRMFQAGIEPSVSVSLHGSLEANAIEVHNDSGCSITDMQVSVSVGTSKDGQEQPWRRCIYTYTWPHVGPSASVKSQTQPISPDTLFDGADKNPKNDTINPQDLLVDYSFKRAADSRSYAYRYRVGIVGLGDGRHFYIPLHEPEQLPHNKQIVLTMRDRATPDL